MSPTPVKSASKPHGVPQRKWNLLWRCKDNHKWRAFWNGTYGDILNCEYAMCSFMWTHGFTEPEIITVMSVWYKHQGIKGNFYALRHTIIPNTYAFVKELLPGIIGRYHEKRRLEQARHRAKVRIEGGKRAAHQREQGRIRQARHRAKLRLAVELAAEAGVTP